MSEHILTATVQVTAPGVQQTFAQVATSAGKAETSLRKIAPGANAANLALINTGRVVQDLPFGFIGIQNNLNPLLESFQRLKVETGSSRLALQGLGKSLIGAGGIGFALSIASTALLLFTNGFQSFSRKSREAKESADKVKQAFTDLASGLSADLVKLTTLVGVIENVNTSQKNRSDALKAINEQYTKYLPNLDREKITAENIAKSYDLITDSLIRQAVVKGIQKEIEAQVESTAKQILAYKRAEEERKIATDKANEATKNTPTPMQEASKALANYNKTSKDGLQALTSQRLELRASAAEFGNTENRVKALTEELKAQLAPLLKLTTEFGDLGIDLKTDKISDVTSKIIALGKRLVAEFGDVAKIHLDLLPTFSALDTPQEELSKAKEVITKVNAFFNNFSSQQRPLKLVIPVQPEVITGPVENITPQIKRTQAEILDILKQVADGQTLVIAPDIEIDPNFKLDFSLLEAVNLDKFKQGLKQQLVEAFSIKIEPIGLTDTEKQLQKIQDESIAAARAVTDVLTPAFQDLFTAIVKGDDPLKSFFQGLGQAVEQLISKLIAAAVEALVLSAIFGSVGGASGFGAIFSKILGFAGGGRPPLDRDSVVGEQGPELFRPDRGRPILIGVRGPQLFKPPVPGTVISNKESFRSLATASTHDSVTNKELFKEIKYFTSRIGFRATGGSVGKDKPFIVGERGPELFKPSQSGTIIPSHRLQSFSKTIAGSTMIGGARVANSIQNKTTNKFLSANFARSIAGGSNEFLSSLAKITNNNFGGFKAGGGSVQGGKLFVVGEQGAELFIPNTGAQIRSTSVAAGNVGGNNGPTNHKVVFEIAGSKLRGVLSLTDLAQSRLS